MFVLQMPFGHVVVKLYILQLPNRAEGKIRRFLSWNISEARVTNCHYHLQDTRRVFLLEIGFQDN